MADGFEIEVHGVEELLKAMEESNFTPALEKQVFRPGLRAGGKLLMKEMKASTPVDTRELKRGYKLRAIPRSRSKIGVRITLTAPHAAPVELGYYRGRKIPGQRFMRDALHRNRQRAIAETIAASKNKLPSVIAKHARKHRTNKG